MKRYLLYAWDNQIPVGGCYDFIESNESLHLLLEDITNLWLYFEDPYEVEFVVFDAEKEINVVGGMLKDKKATFHDWSVPWTNQKNFKAKLHKKPFNPPLTTE